jgi:hypothetical protein
MLTRANFGLHVTGRIDSISELQHREGKTQKGSDYSFYQQSVTVTLGGSLVEVVFRTDTDPKAPLVTYQLDDIVRLRVENPRIFNGKVSFDVAK